jgi:hypothetical protein
MEKELGWLRDGRFGNGSSKYRDRHLVLFKITTNGTDFYYIHIANGYRIKRYRDELLREHNLKHEILIMKIPFKLPYNIKNIQSLIEDLAVWVPDNRQRQQRFKAFGKYAFYPDFEHMIVERILLFSIMIN